MSISRIGIIGAGQMGTGIAHVMALANYEVILNDVLPEHLISAKTTISQNLDRQISANKISGDEASKAISGLSSYAGIVIAPKFQKNIKHVEFIRVNEEEELKRKVFLSIMPYLGEHTVLTSNTSSISITRLASSTDRPEKFLGFHFMNPVPIMQLVELIPGIATTQDTFEKCAGVVDRLGKTVARSEDFPAFIVNRILIPMINEAIYTLYEGVGSVEAIDTSLKLGANHPMGPLELADFIGLDTCLAIMNVLHDGLADTKYRPCPLLTKYVEAGWLGRKSKRGFYDYRTGTPSPTR